MNEQTLIRTNHNETTTESSAKIPAAITITLAAWGTGVAVLALVGFFDAPVGERPLAILLAVTVPIAAYGILIAFSRTFQNWIDGLDERPLILLHTFRMLGLGFVFLYFRGELPALFAFPAGLGDGIAAIGAFVIGIALFQGKTVSRLRKLAWNTFGLLDFVAAIVFGIATRTVWNGGISSAPMGEFPLAVIPGFIVPFYVIIHLILCRKWS